MNKIFIYIYDNVIFLQVLNLHFDHYCLISPTSSSLLSLISNLSYSKPFSPAFSTSYSSILFSPACRTLFYPVLLSVSPFSATPSLSPFLRCFILFHLSLLVPSSLPRLATSIPQIAIGARVFIRNLVSFGWRRGACRISTSLARFYQLKSVNCIVTDI